MSQVLDTVTGAFGGDRPLEESDVVECQCCGDPTEYVTEGLCPPCESAGCDPSQPECKVTEVVA